MSPRPGRTTVALGLCAFSGWWAYVQRIAAHATSVDIADKSGLTPSAITRWKQGDVPRAENAIAFARAYNRPPKEALVVAGYLDAVEADATIELPASISDIPDDELAAETSRRITGYGTIIEEIRRRAANNDPRQIVPGSADDVFPAFGSGDDTDRRAWRV